MHATRVTAAVAGTVLAVLALHIPSVLKEPSMRDLYFSALS